MNKYYCKGCGQDYLMEEFSEYICAICNSQLQYVETSEVVSEEGPTSEEVRTDKKYDEGKAMVGLMKRDFPDALLAVAEVATYGVKKYNQPGSWKLVENAPVRYEDALGRHDLMMNIETHDEESGLLHAAHRAWNALATLQMYLEEECGEE